MNNVLKTRQMNHTLMWAMIGLIVFGGLAITFLLMSMIEMGLIAVLGTVASFFTILMQGTTKPRKAQSINRQTIGGN